MQDFIVRHAIALALMAPIGATAIAQTQQGADAAALRAESVAQAIQDQSGPGATEIAPAVPPAGPQLGQHVSGMAPQHPKAHGEMFGDCVSELAVTGECSHHQ